VWLAMFLSKKLWTRLMALALGAPPVFFCAMAGAPWSVVPALVLLLFLAALAWENYQEQRETKQLSPDPA
jgi:predicted membrane metal-binding protein